MRFSRGYEECRSRMEKGSRFLKSCFNCAYYYQEHGDKEEMCQNTEVLEYDMVVDGNNISCIRWKPSSVNLTKEQSLFKKNGRSRLD